MTTLWARLLLGDLFVHGIGGAKYDQVTDVLIERFFGLSPPGFMVLSATLLLPVDRPQVTPERSRHIRQQLRELEYHPEQYIDGSCRSRFAPADGPSGLIAAKNRWVRTPQTPQNARARCRGIRQINEALQPWVAARRERLQRELAETLGALRTKQILGWREYGFCLYPESTLRRFLARLLPKNA